MNYDNLHELINRYEEKIDVLYGTEHYELFKLGNPTKEIKVHEQERYRKLCKEFEFPIS